jgi:hypothetical protein
MEGSHLVGVLGEIYRTLHKIVVKAPLARASVWQGSRARINIYI